LGLSDLIAAPVDWELLDRGISGEGSRRPKKTLRAHQQEVVEKAHQYFQSADRGKLIMACGTGKTYTALRIAEKETGGSGLILFLVPSIALLIVAADSAEAGGFPASIQQCPVSFLQANL